MSTSTLVTPGQAAKLLNVNTETLRAWSQQGKIASIRTKGGHRRFKEEDVLYLKEQQMRMMNGEGGSYVNDYKTYTQALDNILETDAKHLTMLLPARPYQDPAQEARISSVFRKEAEMVDEFAGFLKITPRALKMFVYQFFALLLFIKVFFALNPLLVNKAASPGFIEKANGLILIAIGTGMLGNWIINEAIKDTIASQNNGQGLGFVKFKYSLAALICLCAGIYVVLTIRM